MRVLDRLGAWTRSIWEGEPPELRSPALVCAFARLERRRERGDRGARGRGRVARRRGGGPDRPGGVLRLPGQPADDPPRRGTDPRDRLAGEHAAGGRRCPRRERDLALLSGVEPNVRWRTFADAIVDAAERLGRRDRHHPRRADRRRRAHPAGADHGPRVRLRTWSSASASAAPATRGRPGSSGVLHDACRRQRARPRRACGRRSRTTSPRFPTRRRRWRCCAAWRA